jgi:hypothetical protein
MASITTRRRSPDREFAVANLNAKDRIAEACVTPWAAQSAEGGTHKKTIFNDAVGSTQQPSARSHRGAAESATIRLAAGTGREQPALRW